MRSEEEKESSSVNPVYSAYKWTRKRTLLMDRTCRYHSLTLKSVALRVRSNMKRIATASLQTSGSMLMNSRWPVHAASVSTILLSGEHLNDVPTNLRDPRC
jgi:hypothetical protein